MKMFAFLLLLIASFIYAQEPKKEITSSEILREAISKNTQDPVVQDVHSLIDLQKAEAWIDSAFLAGMEEYRIPGTIITIVRGDSLFLNKGYGFADLENQIPIDPEKTGFRVASITKLLTASAIMQLHQKDEIQINDPVDQYLNDVDVNFNYHEPVTFHHLLTHTSGFDNSDINDAAKSIEKIIPLNSFINQYMTEQVFPPGLNYHYSNFGFTLAGLLVNQISGMEFHQYLADYIFKPLGMKNSSLSQPLPEDLRWQLSKSYDYKNGEYIPLSLDFSNVSPADGLVTTGADMAKFMIAHLNHGGSLMDSTTAAFMHRQQYTTAKSKYGVAYAFHENFFYGKRILEHSGAQLGFLSLVTLIPDEKIGIFISQNKRNNAGGLRGRITYGFLRKFLEKRTIKVDTLIPSVDFVNKAKKYSGVFRQINYPHSTFEKIAIQLGFRGSEIKVINNKDGTLSIQGFPFVEIEPNIFQYQNTSSTWKNGFREDNEGNITHLLLGTSIFEKIPWYKQSAFMLPLLFGSMLLLIFNGFGSIRFLVKNKFRLFKGSLLNNLATLCMYLSGLFFLLFYAGFSSLFMIYRDKLLDYGVPFSFKLTLVSLLIATIFTAMLPLLALAVWREPVRPLKSKIWYSIVTIISLIFVMYLYDANMIGFNY
ncbi:MAG: serine hydrolase [Bacteroidetes bacterium]|nr:serine hydrolase [Bacteroidota bacterium]